MIGRLFLAFVIVVLCLVSLTMGNVEDAFVVELSVMVMNLCIAVVLLAGVFFSANHTLAFVHVMATWLLLIQAQFAKLAGGSLHYANYYYYSYDPFPVVEANVAIGMWLMVFAGSYLFSYGKLKFSQKEPPTVNGSTLIIASVLSLGSLLYLYFRLGGIVITRAAFDAAFQAGSTIEAHLVEFPLRAMPFYTIGAYLLVYKTMAAGWRRTVTALACAVLTICTLIVNNPLAASRFFLGVVAIGFMYLGVLRHARSNLQLFVFVLVGVFGMLPLDFGRYALTLDDAVAQIHWSPKKVLLDDVFSTFESVPAAVVFTDTHGTTWGRQLFGNMLFFIPRFLWPDKPIGSGAFMIETEFGPNAISNASCAAPGEGLINFGFPGVVVLAASFGVLLGYLDKKRALLRRSGWSGCVFLLFYAFFIGHVFLITRGDLLSPLALMVSMSLAYVIIRALAKARLRITYS